MGAMSWLNCLGKISNDAMPRAEHGLGAGYATKAWLAQESLVASISY